MSDPISGVASDLAVQYRPYIGRPKALGLIKEHRDNYSDTICIRPAPATTYQRCIRFCSSGLIILWDLISLSRVVRFLCHATMRQTGWCGS